jgi:aminoglycoside phosphotransferase family enzyme/predicted kinase
MAFASEGDDVTKIGQGHNQIMHEPLPPSSAPLIAALAAQLQAEVVETHASWVLLAGELAWKIKKPISLPFLDYSTLEQREAACRAEVRLNRRLAPALYLAVVAIGGTVTAPCLRAEPAIEWAVQMRRFDGQQQLDRICARGELSVAQLSAHLSELAAHLVAFQRAAAVASTDSRFGSPSQVLAPASENFDELRQLLPDAEQALVASLAVWTTAEFRRIEGVLRQRQRDGFVREGHGDLHLGNLALIDGVVTPFDGIEFNDDLRWIDVASDIAFTWVDLLDHRQPGLAAWFLSAWREASGDIAALTVMRFYAVYRAVVRAKIAAIRARQENDRAKREFDQSLARDYLELAQRIAVPPEPTLTITVGLSGSGKTTASAAVLLKDATGSTLRLRSDVERKRLFGLDPLAVSATAVSGGIYTPQATIQTYSRLRADAETLLTGNWSVVVDAAFLRYSEREEFRQLARRLGVRFQLLDCRATVDELRRRLMARTGDASEATVAVLEQQCEWFEPLTPAELESSTQIV